MAPALGKGFLASQLMAPVPSRFPYVPKSPAAVTKIATFSFIEAICYTTNARVRIVCDPGIRYSR